MDKETRGAENDRIRTKESNYQRVLLDIVNDLEDVKQAVKVGYVSPDMGDPYEEKLPDKEAGDNVRLD